MLSVGLSMLMLGYWVERQIRAGWLQGMGETGAVYLEAILSPHLQVLASSPDLPVPQRQSISALLSDTRLGGRVAMIKIWSSDGKLLFATRPTETEQIMPRTLLNRVKAGHVSVDLETDAERDPGHGPVPPSLLEIYAPMYKSGTRDVIAIGEFYEYSRALESEVRRVKLATWFLILNVGVFIGVLLLAAAKRTSRIITAQQTLLERNVARSAALAKRNNVLRRSADQARLRAAVLNETYLARVGADLHDGPIQMLSLMMLKLPGQTATESVAVELRQELKGLIEETLGDLRNLSAGLVLPELKQCSLAETVELVVSRHEQQTGTLVARSLAPLPAHVPEAVKVCVYRIIQEALINAFKHAGGVGQSVEIQVESKILAITIADSGGEPSTERAGLLHAPSLGLRGMEARIQSLRGRLSIIRRPIGGLEVRARIPIQIKPQSILDAPEPEADAGPRAT